jgi:hypothetical protein
MRTIAALALTATALLVGSTASPPADASVAQGTTFLDNGIVRIGVDMSNGAKITFVGSAAGTSTNLVQDVQPSYSSGPYGTDGLPGWHAFSSGATTVLESRNDGKMIYTKTIAADERSGPCECLFEQWVTVGGRAIHVRNRLTAFRSDATRYPASPQEPSARPLHDGPYAPRVHVRRPGSVHPCPAPRGDRGRRRLLPARPELARD